jgi:phytoene synthase
MASRDEELARLSEAAIRSGSKSFASAARLFNARTRASVHLLYAWCRACDDAIDGQVLGHRTAQSGSTSARDTLARLRSETQRALNGHASPDPVFQGLQRVAERHAIPHHHFFELLDGFAMDVAGRSYDTLEETLDYCYYVAGVVGVMMSMIMGPHDEETLDRAAELGIAFQLTNIARDVIDDAHVGRIYLPRRWLDAAGVPLSDIAAPEFRPALFQVVHRLLDVADGFYDASVPGVARLPLRAGWAVETARVIYREIGREVIRRGPAAWDQRVTTSRRRKVAAIGQSVLLLALAHTRASVVRSPRTSWTRPRVRRETTNDRAELADERKSSAC